jgi:hypothetical protein
LSTFASAGAALATSKGDLTANLWNRSVARFVFHQQQMHTFDIFDLANRDAEETMAVARDYFSNLSND